MTIKRKSPAPIHPGQVYGRLTVLREAESKWYFCRERGTKRRTRCWLCKCQCGSETIVHRSVLGSGHTKSCGCWQRESRFTHGASKTPEYQCWSHMKFRCTNPADPHYKDYGGRGIKVCDRWQSFERFFSDMGTRPSSKHSIERCRNDLGYEPSNCCWAIQLVQCNNMRSSRPITFNRRT